jgi:hypothetical protein
LNAEIEKSIRTGVKFFNSGEELKKAEAIKSPPWFKLNFIQQFRDLFTIVCAAVEESPLSATLPKTSVQNIDY